MEGKKVRVIRMSQERICVLGRRMIQNLTKPEEWKYTCTEISHKKGREARKLYSETGESQASGVRNKKEWV